MRLHRWLVPTLVALSLATGRVAQADDATEGEVLITKGVALRQEGKDADALALFRQAYEKNPSARARAQMGLAEQALGMWLKAEDDLKAALEGADAWVERYREPLESALRTVRGRLGSLEIVANVGDAEVFIDGAALGRAGRAFRVEAGTRTVLVKSPGHHAVSRSVVVPGGGVARETFELVVAPPDAAETRPGVPTESDGRTQRTLGLGLLTGGGLLLAAGGASQLVRLSIVNAYNDDSLCPGENVPKQPAACADRISAARSWQTVAIVGYAVGGALALSGAVVLLTAPRRTGAISRTKATCAPEVDAHGAYLTCVGRF